MSSNLPGKPLRRALRYAGLILSISSLSLLPASMTETGCASDTPPAVAMVVQTGAAMRYWPHWRGPSIQGIVEGKGYPDTFVA